MNAWRVFSLIGFGGVVESGMAKSEHDFAIWAILFTVSLLGWGWSSAFHAAGAVQRRVIQALTGRPAPLPATDPKALAAEIEALNAQIATLRDTATSFDVSFDQTLARMDERLRRIEQQSSYVNVGH